MNALATITGEVTEGDARILITANGATIEGEPSETTCEQVMAEFAAAGRACQFVIGDLINHTAARAGEKYARWMEVTGLDYQTLANAASVCRAIPIEKRRPGLSFSHHKEVARLAPDARERWLDEAESRSMSKERLRRSIQLGRPATPEDMSAAKAPAPELMQMETKAQPSAEPPAPETVHPYVNRLAVLLGKWEGNGFLESMDAKQLHGLHRDLLPVLTRYGAILRQLLRIAPGEIISAVVADLRSALGPLAPAPQN